MPCNCGGRRQTATRYQLTLQAGTTFADGTTSKTFLTKGEAEGARSAAGGGIIRPVTK
jgi:hypothetical protein